ncbi:glycoside hydrolase family 3 protein [Caldicellulosiruptoraceae bacterium PP1]
MINLKDKPFYLSDEDINWVNETLSKMTTKEKVGQLFCLVVSKEDVSQLLQELKNLDMKPCGFMQRPFMAEKAQENSRILQESFDIPLLIAANLERGGNGIAIDGTNYASQLEVAATDDEEMAYRLGVIAGREGRTIGCNWAFAPVIDIDYNFNNPITNTRTYGSDPNRVLRLARAYMKGIQENGLAVSIKHWPGDGVDGRDQHLVASVNSLSTEEWDKTYGYVYKGMIDEGAETVMSAHILQPAYSRLLRPGIKDEDIMPASLAPELNIDLLRGKLGFNGLIVTDATSMAGFAVAMPRELAVPTSIAAGCDMFLFTMNLEEDFNFMLKGVEKGIITEERLNEAVTRILALKARLRLHIKQKEGNLVPDKSALSVIKCEEHERWARECADKAVTLVKDTQKLLPISPEKHKKVLLYILGDIGGYMDDSKGINGYFIKLLEQNGFEITKYDYSNTDFSVMNRPISFFKNFDLIVYFASLKTQSNQTVVRINWAQPMGSDVPKFVKEVPTLFISVDNPYHLQDVPMVKTFINGYNSSEYVVEAVVEKILGRSEFKGINPVDPFCGYWDATL